jgi:hypothetical protein
MMYVIIGRYACQRRYRLRLAEGAGWSDEQNTMSLVCLHPAEEGTMPRFYFDVREGPQFTPDHEGLEFNSLDAADRRRNRAYT